jgi:hypothetical protein
MHNHPVTTETFAAMQKWRPVPLPVGILQALLTLWETTHDVTALRAYLWKLGVAFETQNYQLHNLVTRIVHASVCCLFDPSLHCSFLSVLIN